MNFDDHAYDKAIIGIRAAQANLEFWERKRRACASPTKRNKESAIRALARVKDLMEKLAAA